MKNHSVNHSTAGVNLIANGYLASIKARFDALAIELQTKREELALTTSRFERERERLNRLPGAESGIMNLGGSDRRALTELQSRIAELERVIRDVQSEHRSLDSIVSAPERLSTLKAKLHGLSIEHQALQERRQKTDAQIVKVRQRVGELEDQVAVQTRAAPLQCVGNDKPFEVPESLIRLETEFRLAQSALADLEQQRRDINDAILASSGQISDTRDAFKSARAQVCDIELQEQLRPLMRQIARAAVSKHQVHGFFASTTEMRIRIDQELIEPVEQELAAELAALV